MPNFFPFLTIHVDNLYTMNFSEYQVININIPFLYVYPMEYNLPQTLNPNVQV